MVDATRVEILAPAGSPESLLAALESRADAVYLGLKRFNARGNAVNFTPAELSKLVPMAHAQGTKVYLTLNTLVKMDEREGVLDALSEVQACGIDGVIFQDLGLSRILARHFPKLRRHASTQMAIHNLEGVRFCVDEGIDRVVLARELTLGEIAEIRASFPSDVIELEVFCHGAMCYTYSGMCFFSGSVGGRSGNRGECAYTCRKGYKIHNETRFPRAAPRDSFGNYLFSMKDMNTLEVLPALIETGIDSLKIEGRRKGPAYVGASVQAYRARMAGEMSTSRERDLDLSFGRSYTKAFYLRGQFGDHPIDLKATGTKGVPIGVIDDSGWFTLTDQGVQRYDGIRLVTPDHAEHLKPFNHYEVSSGDRHQPELGTRIRLRDSWPVGTVVRWVRSQAVEKAYRPKRRVPKSSADATSPVANLRVDSGEKRLFVRLNSGPFEVCRSLELQPSNSGKAVPLKETLFRFGDVPFSMGNYDGPAAPAGFVPVSVLKRTRRELFAELAERVAIGTHADLETLKARANQSHSVPAQPVGESHFSVRLDQLDLVESLSSRLTELGCGLDILLRPTMSTPDWKRLLTHLDGLSLPIRLVFPLVLRKWDLRVLKRRLADVNDGRFDFVLSNPSHRYLVAQAHEQGASLHADFSLYHLNNWAWDKLDDWGIDGRFTLSLEDDKPNMDALLQATDPSRFEAIAYTDTPLFIAEACSLAALYGGCPGAKACGHETLHIENEHGDQFQVRHDRCRSTVIGDQALSWSGQLNWFKQRGVHHFRVDLTVRPYERQQAETIIAAIRQDRVIPQTHTENLNRILL